MRTDDGQGKGFGFVTMAEDQDAVRAVLKLNRSTYKERTIEVRFKLRVSATATTSSLVDYLVVINFWSDIDCLSVFPVYRSLYTSHPFLLVELRLQME